MGRNLVAAGERFPDVRSLPLYAMKARARARDPLTGTCFSGWTTVVSGYGCYVRTAEAIAVGTVWQLELLLGGTYFETWARVANAVPGDGVVLTFFDTMLWQRELLRWWIKEAANWGY
jgi:hypothetical protein